MSSTRKHSLRFAVRGPADQEHSARQAVQSALPHAEVRVEDGGGLLVTVLDAGALPWNDVVQALREAGLSGSPRLQEEFWGRGPRVLTVRIPDMDCPVEAGEIRGALGKEPGVTGMEFHPERRQALFTAGGPGLADEKLLGVLRELNLPGEITDRSDAPGTGTLTVRVPSLDCHAEAQEIEAMLSQDPRVGRVHLDLALHEARVTAQAAPEEILALFAQAGHPAEQLSWKAPGAAQPRLLRVHVPAMDCPVEAGEIRRAFEKSSFVLSLECDTGKRVVAFSLSPECTDDAPVLAVLEGLGYPGTVIAEGARSDVILRVDNMRSESDCGKVLEILGLDAKLDKEERTLSFRTDPAHLFDILSRLTAAGWHASLAKAKEKSPASDVPWMRLAAAVACAAAAEAMEIAEVWEAAKIALSVAAVLLSGLSTILAGVRNLFRLRFNMSTLMAVAVSGAAALGAWPEAAMVMALYELGEGIEQLSMARARRAISSLLSVTPQTACVNVGGRWQTMPVEAVPAGTVYRTEPGERAALDGVVISGSGAMDESMITGESLPVEKRPGDKVWAGSLARESTLEIRATAAAQDSMSARILRAVEGAEQKKARAERFIDRFAAWYTPSIFAAAVATALIGSLLTDDWHTWIYRGLVLLVIGCPCSLVISTPATIVSALALAARRGVLIKGGVYLEQGRLLTNVALDKTGTVTRGEPVFQELVRMPGASEEAAWKFAASLAAMSSHPVSRAVAAAAKKKNIEALPADEFRALPGFGTQGRVEGSLVRLTNLSWLRGNGKATPAVEKAFAALHEAGRTGVAVSDLFGVLGVFAVADEMKENAARSIAAMKRCGITPWLLTGDNAHAAQAVGSAAGIDNVRAELLPEDKLRLIEDIQKTGVTAMAGDGINDAPALARADIGFAMGVRGADSAVEAADVALMDDDIGKIAWFKNLSALTFRTLQQNIAFSLLVKFGFAVLDLAGHATMWMAVFADTGVLLLVVAWGTRLLRAGATVDRMTEQGRS